MQASQPTAFDEMIGQSDSLRRVLDMAQRAAAADVTILIEGESGTGKEVLARAVHRLSARKDGPFIPVNCAAIPEGLLESELFGHERGAFTGAVRSKPGRFELAREGTLFLDEIGDMPPSMQVKILRPHPMLLRGRRGNHQEKSGIYPVSTGRQNSELTPFFPAIDKKLPRILEVIALDNSSQNPLSGNGRAIRRDDPIREQPVACLGRGDLQQQAVPGRL